MDYISKFPILFTTNISISKLIPIDQKKHHFF